MINLVEYNVTRTGSDQSIRSVQLGIGQ